MDPKKASVDDYIPALDIEQNLPVSPVRQSTTIFSSMCDKKVYKLLATPIASTEKTTNNGNQPGTVWKLIAEQSTDEFCKKTVSFVGKQVSQYSVDRFQFFICKAPIDGALQKVEPKSLKAKILHLCHYPVLCSHPR